MPAIEGESLRRELFPGDHLPDEEHGSQRQRCSDPRKGAAQSGTAQAEPLLQHVDLTKNVASAELHRQAAQNQQSGVEIDNGRHLDGMPVPDELVAAWVHVHAGLARKEQHHQSGEEQHGPRQCEENEEADALQALTRTFARLLPVVVASTTSAAGRPAIDRWLAADSWFFSLNLRRCSGKGNGHRGSLYRWS